MLSTGKSRADCAGVAIASAVAISCGAEHGDRMGSMRGNLAAPASVIQPEPWSGTLPRQRLATTIPIRTSWRFRSGLLRQSWSMSQVGERKRGRTTAPCPAP
jgi:hypothetical protein